MKAATSILVLSLAGPASLGPTVAEIASRHIEALGGEEALRAIQTLRKTGTYIYNGTEHPIVSYHKLGRRSREEIDGLQLWGTGRREGHVVVRGTNGAVSWNLDESRGPEWAAIPASRAAIALEDADLTGALFDSEKKDHRVELLDPGDVEGKPALRLKVTFSSGASGIEQIWFLDVETFLLLRKEMSGEEAERDLERPRSWYFDDYRPVNGVLMPYWVYVEEPLFSREYVFETIEVNVPIEDAVFEPPSGAAQSSR
jgi:hypothetical protein